MGEKNNSSFSWHPLKLRFFSNPFHIAMLEWCTYSPHGGENQQFYLIRLNRHALHKLSRICVYAQEVGNGPNCWHIWYIQDGLCVADRPFGMLHRPLSQVYTPLECQLTFRSGVLLALRMSGKQDCFSRERRRRATLRGSRPSTWTRGMSMSSLFNPSSSLLGRCKLRNDC